MGLKGVGLRPMVISRLEKSNNGVNAVNVNKNPNTLFVFYSVSNITNYAVNVKFTFNDMTTFVFIKLLVFQDIE